MSLAYLLDENLPPSLRKQLLRLDPLLGLKRIGDPGAPPLATPDPVILEWCEANGYVLVTNNRHSMPLHLSGHLLRGHHVPGILVVTASLTYRRLVDELIVIAGASLANEYKDQIRRLPIT